MNPLGDPGLLAGLLIPAWLYGRGWRVLRRRDPTRWPAARLAAFHGGLAVIWLALASPIESYSYLRLQVHMVQHLLLMMAAPPLLWLGQPLFPLLRGLPPPLRTYWIGPLYRSPVLRRIARTLTHPITAWLLFVAATWIWHLPRLYELAVSSNGWHYAQHLTFLGTGLLFWYPVVRPYPSRPSWPTWLLLPYLLLADVQNTVLAALLTFADRPLYPHYELLQGQAALEDQAAAGVIMWVPGSVFFLVPLFWIGTRFLFNSPAAKRPARIALPMAGGRSADRFDLLQVPVLGPVLKWRHARTVLQLVMLLLAGLVIWDGLFGPELTPINLAGVLPWIHWRGFVVLGLLVAGNVFCLACPFQLPRKLGRWLLPARMRWPRALRNKWLAVGLVALFFWSYEAFALWNSPWWTAWITLGYFGSALAIDGLFQGASFCKYVCPIGQFHFVQSLTSPLEAAVRDPAICQTCTTKDCIRGTPGGPNGCELELYVPRKAGNLDCTMCLDCIHACPHDNIGIVASAPGHALWHDRPRSGLGRLSRRPDLAALAAVLVAAAFANAAGMTAAVVQWQDRWTAALGLASPWPVITLFYACTLLVLPAVLIGLTARFSRAWSGDPASLRELACRYVWALVPIGAAMWLTHYSFHLLTSAGTASAATQRFLLDLGLPFLGEPEWSSCCAAPPADWLIRLEIVFLDLGLLLSLYTAYRIARDRRSRQEEALKALTPWAAVILTLFAVGVWIVLQPMEMRGTL